MIALELMMFYGSAATSAIIGSAISKSVNRRKLLAGWIIYSIIVNVLLAVSRDATFLLPLSILLGISLGFGIPSCQALLADRTLMGERARVSGLIILITFLLTFIGIIAIPIMGIGVFGAVVFLVFLRAIGFVSLWLDRCERKQEKEFSWRSVITNKEFAYYLLPWLMFNTAAGLLDLSSYGSQGASFSYAFIAIFGLVAGVIADRIGRKTPIIVAVVLFSLSFGLLSYALIPETITIYFIIYGIAWGFLFTLYQTLPGDIAELGSKEKYYALGTVVPLIVFMGLSSLPGLLKISIPVNYLAPAMTVILFISIIPLWRSKETLSEKVLREKEMKKYMDKVGKVIEKAKDSEEES
jgi:MFS family permease